MEDQIIKGLIVSATVLTLSAEFCLILWRYLVVELTHQSFDSTLLVCRVGMGMAIALLALVVSAMVGSV